MQANYERNSVMPQEDWELSSGLRDDITFDIHLATFGFRANFNNGASMLLILVGSDENGEPFEHICSVGADWISPDGKHIQHPSGKNKINRSSRYGQWISACQEIPTLWNYLLNSPGPTDASIWENLKLHLSLKNFTQKIRDESINRDVLVPDAFIGFLDPNAPAQVPTIPQPASFAQPVQPGFVATPQQPLMQPGLQTVPPSTTPVPTPAPVASPVGPTPEQMLLQAQQAAGLAPTAESPIRSQLREIAKVAADHGTFVGQAFAIGGVVADSVLVKELMDPNDFYAKARV